MRNRKLSRQGPPFSALNCLFQKGKNRILCMIKCMEIFCTRWVLWSNKWHTITIRIWGENADRLIVTFIGTIFTDKYVAILVDTYYELIKVKAAKKLFAFISTYYFLIILIEFLFIKMTRLWSDLLQSNLALRNC